MQLSLSQHTLATIAGNHASLAGDAGKNPVATQIVARNGRVAFTTTNASGSLTLRDITQVADAVDGDVAVSASDLSKFAAAMPNGNVVLKLEGPRLTLKAGKVTMQLSTIEVDSCPKVAFPTTKGSVIPAADFVAAATKVIPAASGDVARGVLTGVNITATSDGLRMVATDSCGLSLIDVSGMTAIPEGTSIIAPAAGMSLICRLLADAGDVDVVLGENTMTLSTPTRRIMVRLLLGSYPHYEPILEVVKNTVVVMSKNDLLNAIKRVKLAAAHDNATAFRMRVDTTSGTVSVSHVGDPNSDPIDQIDATVSGADISIAFNPDYLIMALRAADGDEVSMAFNSALKPASITGNGGTALSIAMPLRV